MNTEHDNGQQVRSNDLLGVTATETKSFGFGGKLTLATYFYLCDLDRLVPEFRRQAEAANAEKIVDFCFEIDGEKVEMTWEQLKQSIIRFDVIANQKGGRWNDYILANRDKYENGAFW